MIAPYSTFKVKIMRPKGSKDKQISIGMRLFLVENGELEARHRAKKGSQLVGYIIEQSKDGKEGLVAWLQ